MKAEDKKMKRNDLCLNVFSSRLQYLMKKRGISITQMAEFCGVTTSTFSSYYHGKADPKLSVVMLIAHRLNVTVDELCDLDVIKIVCWQNKQYLWEKH